MAGPAPSRTGPVIPEPPTAIIVPGANIPIVRDPVPLPPPIVNTVLPDPKVLARVAARPAPRQMSLVAAKRGEPEPWAFGRCLADPKLIAADDDGDYLFLDMLWSIGECDYIEGFYVDGVNEGRADFLGHVQHFEGTSTQVASTIMAAEKGGSYDTLASKCHTVARWRSGWSLQIQAALRGLKVIDPRTSPQLRYSTNPALILAKVLTALGYTMNWASVTTAANYCDEIIGSSSPQKKRWEIGGQVLNRVSAPDIIKTLSTYASCFVDLIGDEVYLVPDDVRVANHTVTQDDMIEGTVRVTQSGGRNVPESVTVHGKTFDGQAVSYTYGTPGGAGTNTDLQMPWFQTVHCCGRKAEEVYRKAQHGLTLEFVGFDNGIQRTIGDVGTITNADYGISAVEMALIEHEQVERGRWRKKYVQYDDADYSDVVYTSSENDTSLQNPYLPPTGPTPTAYEYTHTDGAGTTYQRFQITFTGQTWPYLKDYWVVVEHDGLPVMQRFVNHIAKAGSPLAEQTHTLYTDFPLVAAEAYNIKVYVRSNVLALSETPGETWITALDMFDNSYELERGAAYITWTSLENMNISDGASYATAVWAYDEENETNYAELYEHPAAPNIPNDATIDLIRIDIRAWKSATTSVVNIKSMQLIAGNASPQVGGSIKAGQAVTTTAATYTFEGDLAYWGLTNAQALQLFDGSGDGWVQFAGECVDTLAITTMTLTVDWVKLSATFTP